MSCEINFVDWQSSFLHTQTTIENQSTIKDIVSLKKLSYTHNMNIEIKVKDI